VIEICFSMTKALAENILNRLAIKVWFLNLNFDEIHSLNCIFIVRNKSTNRNRRENLLLRLIMFIVVGPWNNIYFFCISLSRVMLCRFLINTLKVLSYLNLKGMKVYVIVTKGFVDRAVWFCWASSFTPLVKLLQYNCSSFVTSFTLVQNNWKLFWRF